VTAFPSIQAALDANPGKMLFVPDGEYSLTDPIRIRHSGSGLYGFGKLVQQNTNSPVIEIIGANDVRVKHWIWHVPEHNCTPFRFDNGQEPDDPPLRDVLVTGNLVYNTGRDGVLTNGTIEKLPPHYRWAVFISRESGSPVGLKFSNNLFAPGTEGISNVPLE